MKILIALLLIVHGLITAAQAGSSFRPSGGIANPSWLGFWPTGLGQSWAWSGLGIEMSALARAGGLLWLLAGAALAAAGLGLLGVIVPAGWWRALALGGALLSLVMLALYLHPFYAVGILSSAALTFALLSQRLAWFEGLGG